MIVEEFINEIMKLPKETNEMFYKNDLYFLKFTDGDWEEIAAMCGHGYGEEPYEDMNPGDFFDPTSVYCPPLKKEKKDALMNMEIIATYFDQKSQIVLTKIYVK